MVGKGRSGVVVEVRGGVVVGKGRSRGKQRSRRSSIDKGRSLAVGGSPAGNPSEIVPLVLTGPEVGLLSLRSNDTVIDQPIKDGLLNDWEPGSTFKSTRVHVLLKEGVKMKGGFYNVSYLYT